MNMCEHTTQAPSLAPVCPWKHFKFINVLTMRVVSVKDGDPNYSLLQYTADFLVVMAENKLIYM